MAGLGQERIVAQAFRQGVDLVKAAAIGTVKGKKRADHSRCGCNHRGEFAAFDRGIVKNRIGCGFAQICKQAAFFRSRQGVGMDVQNGCDPHQQPAADRPAVMFNQVQIARRNPGGFCQGILRHADIFAAAANAVSDGGLAGHVATSILTKFTNFHLSRQYIYKKIVIYQLSVDSFSERAHCFDRS